MLFALPSQGRQAGKAALQTRHPLALKLQRASMRININMGKEENKIVVETKADRINLVIKVYLSIKKRTIATGVGIFVLLYVMTAAVAIIMLVM
jgi:uncharacterized membrane protein